MWVTGGIGGELNSLGSGTVATRFCLSCIIVPLTACLGLIGISLGFFNKSLLVFGIVLIGITIFIVKKQRKCKMCKK